MLQQNLQKDTLLRFCTKLLPRFRIPALAAAIDVARAQSAVADTALPAIVKIFDTGGASAVRNDLNLHRHWRNARTVVAHNPIDYKKWAVGNWEINRTESPRNSYF